VLGQKAQLTQDGALRNLEEGHLVGSSASLRTCLDYLARNAVCTPSACARVASANPLALLALSASDLASRKPMIVYQEDQGCFVDAGCCQ